MTLTGWYRQWSGAWPPSALSEVRFICFQYFRGGSFLDILLILLGLGRSSVFNYLAGGPFPNQ